VRTHRRAATDEDLASAIAVEPNEKLCTELFHRYNKRIYLWCFNYTHNEEDAVDLAQEILVKIFKNIGSFSHLSRFSTWVYQVTRNHCIGELSRKRAKWRKRMLSIDETSIADEDSFVEIDVTEDLERILNAAKESMKGDELEAFILHYRDGLAVNEITKVLGCENITGARTLIQNARRKFKRLVAERGFGDG
jgi:RNA polymerase sigma factor (sigma-70 family)